MNIAIRSLLLLLPATTLPAQSPLQLARSPVELLGAVSWVRQLHSLESLGRAGLVGSDGNLYLYDPVSGFLPAGNLLPPGTPFQFHIHAIADMDRDGHPDLILNNSRTSDPFSVGVLLNDGKGNFHISGLRSSPLHRGGGAFYEMIPIDLDRDGYLDLVLYYNDTPISQGPAPSTMALKNDRNGNFILAFPPLPAVPPASGLMAKGDFNRDGIEDLVIGMGGNSTPPGQAYLWLGNGDGSFRDAGPLPVPSARTRSIAVGDVDRDGSLDIMFGNSEGGPNSSPYNQLLLGDGKGSFRNVSATHLLLGPSMTVEVRLADVDGDGWLDLVLIDSSEIGTGPGPLYLCRNDGQGRFLTKIGVEPLRQPVVPPLLIADLDGKGLPDLCARIGGAWATLRNRGRLLEAPSAPVIGGRFTTLWHALSPGPPTWHVVLPMVSAGAGDLRFPGLPGRFGLDPARMVVCDPLLVPYGQSVPMDLQVPFDPVLQGLPVYLQGLVLGDLVFPVGRWGFCNTVGRRVR